jgi:hypothetical protein
MDVIFRSLPRQRGLMISEIVGSAGTQSRPGKRLVSRLPALGYADDVILFAGSSKDAEALLQRLEATAALFGLFINTGKGKTEVLYAGPVVKAPIYASKNRLVPECTQYKYLGALLGTSWREDFKRRKQLAWCLLHRYHRTWSSSTCNAKSKLHLFHALVVPTLTYSVCTYPWTGVVRSALNSAYNSMLRYAMGERVDWRSFSHTPIEQLMGNHLFLTATIVYNRLREHGHWVRQHLRTQGTPILHPVVDVLQWETRLPTSSVQFRVGGRLSQGPRDGLLTMAFFDTYDDLCRVACNKGAWRRLVEEETLREQLSVARDISARRARENRPWSQSDHIALLCLAEARAQAKFDGAA